MKNYTNWLISALLLLCFQSFGQIDPSLMTLKNRPIQSPAPVQQNKFQKNLQTAKCLQQQQVTKPLITVEKVEHNAFNYLVGSNNELIRLDTNRKFERTVVSSPADFDFKNSKMTIMYENGNLMAVNPQSEGKKIAENLFGVTVQSDEPDSIIFNNGKGILWRGEYFEKIPDTDLDDHYRKPQRVKKVKEPNYVRITERVPETVEEFLDEYEDDIRKSAEIAKIPFAIKCGQILTEASLRGKMSKMARQINNLGGVKCGGGNCTLGEGHHGVYKDDTDHDTFQKYATPTEFLQKHNEFLMNNRERYGRCFECGEDVECWLFRLQQSGYASHKHYDKLIASVINHYRLTQSPLRYNRAETAKRLKSAKF